MSKQTTFSEPLHVYQARQPSPTHVPQAPHPPAYSKWTAVPVQPGLYVLLDGTGVCGPVMVPCRRDVKGFNGQPISWPAPGTTGQGACPQAVSTSTLTLSGVMAPVPPLQRIKPPHLDQCSESAVVPTTARIAVMILPAIQKTWRIITMLLTAAGAQNVYDRTSLRMDYLEVGGHTRILYITSKSKPASYGDGQESSVTIYKGVDSATGNLRTVRATHPADELPEKEREDIGEGILADLAYSPPPTRRHFKEILTVLGITDADIQLAEESATPLIQAWRNDASLHGKQMFEDLYDETRDKKHGAYCRYRRFIGSWLCRE